MKFNPNAEFVDAIGPGDLLSSLAKYIEVAALLFDISEEEATRRMENADGGEFALESLVQALKDTQTLPGALYYSKFHADEEGEVDSIHHGWCFDSFATVNGREVGLLQALQFADTKEGILSAFFVSVMLPTIGAYWHGLYERDYQIVESQQELEQAISGDDLKQPADDTEAILKIPLGLRIRKLDGNTSCKCLCLSETEGLLDIGLVISADGFASEPARTVIRETKDRILY